MEKIIVKLKNSTAEIATQLLPCKGERGETGKVYVPVFNEKNGVLDWQLSDVPGNPVTIDTEKLFKDYANRDIADLEKEIKQKVDKDALKNKEKIAKETVIKDVIEEMVSNENKTILNMEIDELFI